MTLKSLAATPPMGWNSWNMFGSAIHETVVRETADAVVSSGLKDCGYEYIVIDDCWSIKGGRDPNGDLVAGPNEFPLWDREDVADFTVELIQRVQPHETILLKITPTP
jgi:hypothetical protein